VRKEYKRDPDITTVDVKKFILSRFKEDEDEHLKKQKHTAKRIYGSGLDPHISPQAAKLWVPLIAKATDLDAAKLNSIIADCTEGSSFGILGKVRVNVLKANIEIKKLLD